MRSSLSFAKWRQWPRYQRHGRLGMKEACNWNGEASTQTMTVMFSKSADSSLLFLPLSDSERPPVNCYRFEDVDPCSCTHSQINITCTRGLTVRLWAFRHSTTSLHGHLELSRSSKGQPSGKGKTYLRTNVRGQRTSQMQYQGRNSSL